MKRCRSVIVAAGLIACLAAMTGCQSSNPASSASAAKMTPAQAARERRLSPAARRMEARKRHLTPAEQAAAARQVSAAATQQH